MNDWFEAEQHIEKAHEHYEAGRWEEAETALREALALNPYRPEWHFNLGLTLEAGGRYTEAARAFEDCFKLEEQDPHVAMLVGNNLLRSGEAKTAIGWFERAQRLAQMGTGGAESEYAEPPAIGGMAGAAAGPGGRGGPGNVEAMSLVRRVEAYAMLREHEQAELMFYMSQQLDPNNAEALVAMADSLIDRGLIDKAVWCLREAAAKDPAIPGVHAKLARAYATTGRLERARQLYLRELRSDPGDIETLLDLGCLLVDMNRTAEAGEKFRRVLELEPDNVEAHFQLAELFARDADAPSAGVASAHEHYGVVLRLDADYPGARRGLARLLLSTGDARGPGRESQTFQARELLEAELKSLAEKPEFFQASDLEDLAQVLLDVGRPDDARRVLGMLKEQRPSDVQAMHLYSVACFMLGGEWRKVGIESCREVLRLNPGFLPAMHNMAVAFAQMHEWRRARYWVRQGLRIDEDDAALKRLRFKLRFCVLSEIGAGAAWAVRALNPLRPERAKRA